MDSQDLAYAGIAAQAEMLRAGEVSPRELLEVYLDRIERIDPRLRCFRTVFEERARAEAEQAEARLRAGDARPLLGVPVAIKDSVDMAGEVSTHGSLAFDQPATADADVIQRLRAAGAVIVGRTHMPELAIFPFTESQAFGITQSPWKEGHSVGGSSGGSGAAVAAGLVGAAYASDGGGSIRIPAACGGLFGLKPQRGRVSLAPSDDHWHGLSVAGCVTRGVADTALWLDTVAANPPERPFAESARTPPGKLRIALSMRTILAPVRLHSDVRAAIYEMVGTLQSLGHEVTRHDVDYGTIFPSFLARWLRGISDDAGTAPRPDLLERRTRELAWAGRRISDSLLARARDAERGHAARINAVFDRDGYDVVMTPLLPQPPDRVGRFAGRGALTTSIPVGDLVAWTTAWNATGQPAASVPAGFTGDGLPLAVQLVGRPSDEATLISLAAQIEAETRWTERRPPA